MLSKDDFVKLVTSYRNLNKSLDQLYDLGIDLTNWEEMEHLLTQYVNMIVALMETSNKEISLQPNPAYFNEVEEFLYDYNYTEDPNDFYDRYLNQENDTETITKSKEFYSIKKVKNENNKEFWTVIEGLAN